MQASNESIASIECTESRAHAGMYSVSSPCTHAAMHVDYNVACLEKHASMPSQVHSRIP